MFFDRRRPHVFRPYRVHPDAAEALAATQREAARSRAARSPGCDAWTVNLALDRTRGVVIETWSQRRQYEQDIDSGRDGAALYTMSGGGSGEPATTAADETAGVIVIDIFPVWRPLARAVGAFTLRNGKAFDRQPGCIGTTVLRGLTAGRIATYARWRSEADFLAAFSTVAAPNRGGPIVTSTDEVNATAARMTFGLIRPDYHCYEVVASGRRRS